MIYRVKSKEKSCIRINIRELNEISVQSVYLIYARLPVHTILILAYPKDHVYYIPLTYRILLLF